MNRSTETEVKVGIFVALGLGLIMLTIFVLEGGSNFFQRSLHYKTRFKQIEGLVEGAMVKLSGIRVGQVAEIKLLKEVGQVEITLKVSRSFSDAIKEDSIVGIQTQGVLGDRFIVVSLGSNESPVAKEGAQLKAESPKELKDYLSNADSALDRLTSTLGHLDSILGNFNKDNRSDQFFSNLTLMSSQMSESMKLMKDSMTRLNSVVAKIDRGNGTVGALINDPTLYEDMKSLLGGANRNKVLKYFIKKSVEESREAASTPKK
jgi:phospholipid/cholesterol/gamma-HCH transport system substrate-binding protein